jgi:hypothetical protein
MVGLRDGIKKSGSPDEATRLSAFCAQCSPVIPVFCVVRVLKAYNEGSSERPSAAPTKAAARETSTPAKPSSTKPRSG